MKASLDTNVIIHLYRASKQELLFKLFDEGIYIDEFVYDVELQHHGTDILPLLKADTDNNKIRIVRKSDLLSMGIYSLYRHYLDEEKSCYAPADEGEAHVIALSRTLGAVSVVTDDTKQQGPHDFLVRIKDANMPLAFYEILYILYLRGDYTAGQTRDIFDAVLEHNPELPYEMIPTIKKFIKRFAYMPYTERDSHWFNDFCESNCTNYKHKFKLLIEDRGKA